MTLSVIYLVVAGFRERPEIGVIVLQLGDGQLLWFLSGEEKRRRQTDGQRQEMRE